MLITVLFICIGLADTITITPTQTGVLTHNALCCGYNTYYDSGNSLQWIGDCNANSYGCVSSSLAGAWRWDISSLEGATINSAEIDFTFQNQNRLQLQLIDQIDLKVFYMNRHDPLMLFEWYFEF